MAYIDIIINFFPGRAVRVNGPAYGDIIWEHGDPVSQADLDAHQVDQARLDQTAAINARREVALSTPFEYNGFVWDTDPVSTQNISGMMTFIAAGNSGITLSWRDHMNTNHAMSAQEFTGFFNACCYWRNMVYVVSWELKGAVAQMTDVDQINAMDIDSAWPTTWEQVQAMLVQAAGQTQVTPPTP